MKFADFRTYLELSDKIFRSSRLPVSGPRTSPLPVILPMAGSTHSSEKSPIEEKSAYGQQESVVPFTESQAAESGESTSKPRLPYAWQLTVIILTCLCTCEW